LSPFKKTLSYTPEICFKLADAPLRHSPPDGSLHADHRQREHLEYSPRN
jgi:hypothetical protein